MKNRFVGAALVLLLAVGCSGGDAATVSGTVTFDNQPLKEGVIRFVPTDGKTAPVDAAIRDGKYSAAVPVCETTVSITAPKVVGKLKMYDTPDSPEVEQVKELLPEKYNTKSSLTYTVLKGSQEKNWDLTK